MADRCALFGGLGVRLGHGFGPALGGHLAQLEFLDLAAGGQGEAVHHGDVARDLVPGDLAAAEGAHVFGRHGHVGPGDDEGAHFLAIFAAGHGHHLDVQHAGHAHEEFLDLARVDVLAAADDHVLDAAGDAHVAVLVHGAQVAGMQPAVRADGAGRLFGHIVVALHDVVAAAADFALRAAGHGLLRRRIAQFHFHAFHL